MIDNIKLAVSFSHNDNSNVFSNILVNNGIVTCQNDIVGISLDIDSDINFCCNAARLLKALNNCSPEKLKMVIKNDKLHISSGRFKSFIPTIPIESYPTANNSGKSYNINSDIINIMNSITQFTDPNDVRIALRGVELSHGSVSATNGHVAVKRYIDDIEGLKSVIIPSKSLNIMAKVNAHIDSVSSDENIIFFNFNDGYLFSRTIDQKMPDIEKILTDIKEVTDLSQLKDPIKSISSMCDFDKTLILGKEIKTRSGDASIDGFNLKESAFNADYLQKIIEIADKIDFSPYPGACPFEGDNIRGAIVGIVI